MTRYVTPSKTSRNCRTVRLRDQTEILFQEHLDSPERVLSWNATFDPHDSLLSCGDKLELIIHGLAASTKKPWVQELKDAVIERDPRVSYPLQLSK